MLCRQRLVLVGDQASGKKSSSILSRQRLSTCMLAFEMAGSASPLGSCFRRLVHEIVFLGLGLPCQFANLFHIPFSLRKSRMSIVCSLHARRSSRPCWWGHGWVARRAPPGTSFRWATRSTRLQSRLPGSTTGWQASIRGPISRRPAWCKAERSTTTWPTRKQPIRILK
jgi:hypothetical protein